jgi:hypothetical protein
MEESKLTIEGKHHTISILSQDFVFRSLSRLELYSLRSNFQDQPFILEEEVCKAALISPKEFDFQLCPAGIPTTLANAILQRSGFQDAEYARRLFEKYQDETLEQETRMDMLLLMGLHGIKLEDILAWTPEEYFKKLAMAVFILVNLNGMPQEVINLMLLPRDQFIEKSEKMRKKAETESSKEAALQAQMQMRGR